MFYFLFSLIFTFLLIAVVVFIAWQIDTLTSPANEVKGKDKNKHQGGE